MVLNGALKVPGFVLFPLIDTYIVDVVLSSLVLVFFSISALERLLALASFIEFNPS